MERPIREPNKKGPRRKPDLSWTRKRKIFIKWRRLWETKEILLSQKFSDPPIEIHIRYESLSR